MKHISAILRIAIITLLIALGTTSCNKQRVRERVMNKVGIEALENISGSMAEGWRITLRIKNETAYSPTISNGLGDIFFEGSKVATLRLMEPVRIPQRQTSSVVVPIALSVSNPLKAISLAMRLGQKNVRGIEISLAATIEFAGQKRNIVIERMAADALLGKLGYSLEQKQQ